VSLRLRLTLTLALALLLPVLGLGIVLYALTAADSRADFDLELRTLARAYAQLAVGADRVTLREPPPTPLLDKLGNLAAFLIEPNGRVHDALGAGQIAVPNDVLERVKGGQEASFSIGGDRGAAVFPIFTASSNFGLAYALVIAADDTSGAQSLMRLRATVIAWLMVGALIALIVGDRLAVWLSRPLREVAQTASAVEHGELSQRIPRADARDELGALKRSLNGMLDRLESLVEAQRRFTADAAHDLRTPLTVLKTEVEVALRRPREAPEYRAVLERLLERIGGLSRLAEDLLTLARLEAGPEIPFEPFVVLDALKNVISTTARLAALRGLSFIAEIPPDLALFGDAPMIARAVGNLLGNAISAASTELGLRVTAHGREVAFRVWDDGPGVPPEMRSRLFERFSKGERSKGAGLGLAIVQEVARAHDGNLVLEHPVLERTEKGTVFRMTLPDGLGSGLFGTRETSVKASNVNSNARVTDVN
jgi:two-component system, OmpR family, sensor kinase